MGEKYSSIAFTITSKDIVPEQNFSFFDNVRRAVLKAYNRGLNIPFSSMVFVRGDMHKFEAHVKIAWSSSGEQLVTLKRIADQSGVSTYSLHDILKRGGLI